MNKILVVDDSLIMIDLYVRILEDFNVVTALSAEQALELLDDSFDLVITDLRMDEFDGVWLTERIKEKYNIPVIMVTGSLLDSKEVEHAEASGICAILNKPISIGELINTIEENIEEKGDKRT